MQFWDFTFSNAFWREIICVRALSVSRVQTGGRMDSHGSWTRALWRAGPGVRRPAARASLWGQSPARHARGQTGKSGTEDGLGLFPGRDILSKRKEGGGSNMGAKDITVEQFKGTWANYSNRRIEPGNKQDLCYSMRWIIMDVWQKIIR